MSQLREKFFYRLQEKHKIDYKLSLNYAYTLSSRLKEDGLSINYKSWLLLH
jgi:hypothetical protein